MNRFALVRAVVLGASLALLPAAFAATANAASPEATLRQLVGDADYKAMGLAKLSSAEQARLAEWLKSRIAARGGLAAPPTVTFGVDGTTVTATVVAPAASPAPVAAAPVAAPAVGSAEAFGLEQTKVDGEVAEIRARIVGEFVGWDGKTVFTLDNGQVWRQSMAGVYRMKLTNPEVIIEKGLIGYKLRLVETRRAIAVRRIK